MEKKRKARNITGKLFSRRSTIIFVSLAAAVYLLMAFIGGWESLISITVAPYVIIVFLLLVTLDYVLRGVKWHLYSRELSVDISFKNNIMIFLSGFSMTITPARIGEVFKCYLLKEFTGKKISETLPAVIVERLTDIIALCLLSLFGIFISRSSAILAVIFSFFILIILILMRNKKVYDFSSKLPVLRRFVSQIGNMYESSRSLANKRVIILSVLITLPAWFLEAFGMWFLMASMNIDVSLIAVVFVFSFSSVFGALSMLPGGLGAAEASLTFLLVQLFYLDITTAVWITIVTRACTLWYGTGLGIVFLTLTGKLKKVAKR